MLWAKITYQFEGFHRWAEAKNFLSNLHRHIFHVTVWVEQFHNERDVEYIDFKNRIRGICKMFPDDYSCEIMAESIRGWVYVNYPKRKVKVEVLEDGENGALLE